MYKNRLLLFLFLFVRSTIVRSIKGFIVAKVPSIMMSIWELVFDCLLFWLFNMTAVKAVDSDNFCRIGSMVFNDATTTTSSTAKQTSEEHLSNQVKNGNGEYIGKEKTENNHNFWAIVSSLLSWIRDKSAIIWAICAFRFYRLYEHKIKTKK